jgi:hypothetical protein
MGRVRNEEKRRRKRREKSTVLGKVVLGLPLFHQLEGGLVVIQQGHMTHLQRDQSTPNVRTTTARRRMATRW